MVFSVTLICTYVLCQSVRAPRSILFGSFHPLCAAMTLEFFNPVGARYNLSRLLSGSCPPYPFLLPILLLPSNLIQHPPSATLSSPPTNDDVLNAIRIVAFCGLRFFHTGAAQLNEVEVNPDLKSVPSVGVMRCHLLLHKSGLLQLCVFDFGLLQDREIRVSVLPKRQELLIAGPSL